MGRSHDELLKDLARNVRRHRKTLQLTQEELALQADVDRTYVSQIERGVGNPSLLILSRLAAVLRTDVVLLVNDSPALLTTPRP